MSSKYVGSKLRSEAKDRELGFAITGIEQKLKSEMIPTEKQTWAHISHQGFQTPYEEFEEIFAHFDQAPRLWIDLGAGYGRLALALHESRPEDQFLGYELVAARAEEGNRILIQQGSVHRILTQDLTEASFELPEADVYFIYDYGNQEDVAKTLEDLKKIAQRRQIDVIARGRGITQVIFQNHPWLYCNQDPVKGDHWILFRS
ncbi:MAG: SAM-dependent methyltransferase [Pseudobdellovibrionaceae bacterium]